jgi:Ca-activated chloride channel family protein
MKAPWLLLVCAASAEAAPKQVAMVDSDASKPDEGHLVTRHGGKTIDVPLAHTDVHVRIDGFLADVTVTQRFTNPYANKIEAVYLFPLPTTAAVTDMTIVTGSQRIHGTIHKRADATRIYTEARDSGRMAALVTEERPNLFTQSVANLEPNATIDVELHYTDRLAYDAGGYELVFPMVAGPRYLPGGAKDPVVQPQVLPPGRRSSHDVSLAVELDAGVAVDAIRSTSHDIAVDRVSPSRATIKIAPTDTIPNKDFVLRYQVAGAEPRFGVLPYRDGGTGSFVLVAQPPQQAAAIAPREIVFVLDTSSSMRGAPLAKAKDLVRKVLATLRPDDTYQIVRFDDRASALGPAPIANKPRNIQLTLDWLAKLDAWGGTEMVGGIDAALAVPHDPARLRIVAFITDGYVGNEDQILARVGEHVGASRLFAFGVGSAVNRYLLEEMAAVGRGAVQVVRPDEDTASAVAAFARRIDAPVLTDISIDWAGLAVADVVPHALPDLFAGQPLVVTGHYRGAGSATVKVHGTMAGRSVSFDVPVTLPERDAARPAIATVWARQKIAELSRQLVRKTDPAIEQAIVSLSLAHHLLTPYTAFVAVDESRVTTGTSQRVVVPVEVPDSVAGIPAQVSSGYGMSGGGGGYGSFGTGRYVTIGYGSARGAIRERTISLPPIVVAQPTIVVGSLDRSIIRRYIHRAVDKIRYCYEKALLGKPTLDGTVTTQFLINGDGHVVSSTGAGLDPDVASCVASVIKDIEFPKPENSSGPVQVTYPFTFHPNVIREENR